MDGLRSSGSFRFTNLPTTQALQQSRRSSSNENKNNNNNAFGVYSRRLDEDEDGNHNGDNGEQQPKEQNAPPIDDEEEDDTILESLHINDDETLDSLLSMENDKSLGGDEADGVESYDDQDDSFLTATSDVMKISATPSKLGSSSSTDLSQQASSEIENEEGGADNSHKNRDHEFRTFEQTTTRITAEERQQEQQNHDGSGDDKDYTHLEFLRWIDQKSDPVVEIHEYYQKNGVPDLKQNYTEQNVGSPQPPKWTCTFQCPLTNQLYHSNYGSLSSIQQQLRVLPLVGIRNENDDMQIINLLKQICGEFQVNDDSNIIMFGTKRGAKRFALLSALLSIYTTPKGKSYFSPKIAAQSTTGTNKKSKKKNTVDDSHPQRRRHYHYPNFIKELCRKFHQLGVDPLSVNIVFRERMSSTWNAKNQNNGLSRDTPTLLSSILIITSPICLSVVGLPYQSKLDAVASAMALLGEELQREQQEEKKANNGSIMASRGEFDNDEDIDKIFSYKQNELEHLLGCFKQAATYVYPVPTWANAPISFEKKVYLYEIEFLADNGESFVPGRMGIESEAVTRLGVILAEDIFSEESLTNENVDACKTMFEIPLGNNKAETVTAILKNRTVIDADPTHSLWWIQKFNQLIFSWKSYGFSSRQKEFDVLKDPCPRDRTYLLVPLLSQSSTSAPGVEINWAILREIATDITTTYMTTIDSNWTIPFIGDIDLNSVGWTAIAAHVFFVYIKITNSPNQNLGYGIFYQGIWETIMGNIFALCAVISFYCERFVPPQRLLPTSILENRFFTQRKTGKNTLYVLDQNRVNSSLKTARSVFVRPEEEKVDTKDLRKATYFDYYYKKHGIVLRKPREPLFRIQSVKKHLDHDLCLREELQKEPEFVPQELVQVLPMPRDVLYLGQHFDKFMPAIERVVEVSKFSQQLLKLAYNVHSEVQRSESQKAKRTCEGKPMLVNRSLTSLIMEATAVQPATYERLEFFGDAVLGYFVAINLMARNSKLQFDEEDLADIGSNAVKNAKLTDAALRVGVSRIIETPSARNSWKSAHRKLNPNACTSTNNTHDISLLEYNDQHRCDIPDKTLADVVESLLAVAFIEGRRCVYDRMDGCMIIGILEELRLPLPDLDGKDLQFGWPYFRAIGKNPCLSRGYSFELDKSWQKEFVKLGTILYCESKIISKLEQNWRDLVETLAKMGGSTDLKRKLETQVSKVLLICAIFDDNLDEPSDTGEDTGTDVSLAQNESLVVLNEFEIEEETETELEGLYRVAIFRDTLYYVGHYALYLYVTERIFHKFPLATAGDMHLLRTCASNDDVLCYIFCKAGFHEVLYDRDADAIIQFRYKMMLADSEGSEVWKKNGGWVYGISEFRNRMGVADAVPRYAGLAGGRILGHRTKVPEEFTADLMFSCKALVGALVLSLGVDSMGSCLGSMFDELFLLSPEELRSEYQEISNICKSYKRG